MELTIEFEGFYESIHSMLIDEMMASYLDIDDISQANEKQLEAINIEDLTKKYAVFYLGFVEECINEEYNTKLKLDLIQIQKPREYNFTTDKLIAKNSGNDINNFVLKIAKNDDDFLTWLKEETQNRSGYFSYYDFNDAITNKNEILHVYFFKWFLSNKADDYMQYYDVNNGYELIHY